jgi:uncharacterized Ntn-hydrolase superfamily protein
VNLDNTIYGSFAEIGAGQEAGWSCRSRRSRRSRVMDVPDPCRLNASPLDHWIDMLLAASQHPAGASRRSSKSRGCLQRSLKILQGSCLRDLRDPQNEETMNRSNNPKAWFLVG